jgi:hypothetical protein
VKKKELVVDERCRSVTRGLRWDVLDLLFIGVSILFFVVSIGYVAACDRLMK